VDGWWDVLLFERSSIASASLLSFLAAQLPGATDWVIVSLPVGTYEPAWMPPTLIYNK